MTIHPDSGIGAAGRLGRSLFAALLTAACAGGAGEVDAERGAAARDHIRISFTRNLTMAPVFISEARGFFEEEGIEAELVGIETPATAMPALLQGELDVLPGSLSPAFFNAVSRGGRVRLVADKGAFDAGKCSHQAFVVSKRTLERDPNPDILDRVSTAREPFLQFFVERVLRKRGFDPADSTLFHIPQAAEFDALRKGGVDAAMVGEPWLTRIVRDGGGVVWDRTNELLDGYQYSAYLFGPRLLDREPELGRRVAVALLKGVRAYNRGKTPRNLEIISGVLGYDAAELSEICWPPMRDDGIVEAAGVRAFQEWAFERGDLDAVVAHEVYWDPRFVDHARQVLDAGR